MNSTRFGLVALLSTLVLATAACSKPKPKEVTERDRKEAAHLVSEAQFAVTLRDWNRAEGLYAKAAELDPDGHHWIALGSMRVRLGNKAAAKTAYQTALKSFEAEATRSTNDADPWLKQVYVLALLGRVDEARSVLEKATKRFPNDEGVKMLTQPKQFDHMITAPGFKEIAL